MTQSKKNFDPVNTPLLSGINLIEASAGTGKTYAIAILVLRFIVEQNLHIKNILVVTFTNAATEELKDRIRNRIVEARQILRGNSKQSDSTDANIRLWLQSLNIEPDLILQRLNNALVDIDQASIFTIHGFCQRILAEHALESSQLFDSELMGDISAIKQACSDDFWRKNSYQRSAWELSLLTKQFKTPDQLLASVSSISSSDFAIVPDYEALDQKFIELKQLIYTHKQGITLSLSSIQEKLEEGKFKKKFTDDFSFNSQTLLDWLNEKNTPIPDFSLFTEQGLVDALNGHKFKTSKANPDSSADQKQAYINTLNIDIEAFNQLSSLANDIILVFRRSLLQTLREDVDRRLQQLNVLSFDQLITRLAEALADKKVQSLRQQIQQRYQAALIDEYQDTDPSQWFIFSTLFNLSEHFLYLIGDPKQAIYKFRGADIYAYFAAQQQAQHRYTLGYNWRSHPQLVAAVNALFDRENAFFFKQLDFNPINAALTSEQGVLIKEEKELSPLVIWQLDKGEAEYWTSGKASTEIKTAIVSEILELLNTDFYIQYKDKKPIQAKDIAILVRSHKQAKAFQQALNESGIIAVINSKESVFCSPEAKDLFSLFQAVAQPSSNTLLKQALSLSCFGLNGQQLLQTLNDEAAMDAWIYRFQDYQKIWQKKGLMAMMQSLIDKENILPNLAALSNKEQAERRITNFKHCIELVQQAVIEEHLGINKTLDWLHNNITQAETNPVSSDEQQLRLESDADAIKIITLHSSKGMEYPIVFCPYLWQRSEHLKKEKFTIRCHENAQMLVDLGSEQFEQHRQIALDEELAEDLRVFYVAVTRAKYRCYINWADVRTKTRANESAMAYLLDFSADDFSQQQKKLQSYYHHQPSAFEYRLLKAGQETGKSRQPQISGQKSTWSCKQRQRKLYSFWQMSSYTALSALTVHDVPELPEDKAREILSVKLLEQNSTELPRGAHTGNVIHDLLENIPFQTLAEETDISEQRNKACLRYGLKTEAPEQIDLLLKNTVSTVLSTEENGFSLKQLSEQQCLKEMPFHLSMKTLDVRQINQLLKDCPTYQPLSEKQMSGYLTGFIDLICQYQGKYYVMDYKSNGLESYQQDALVQAMREHNYGLQYWIYTLVLHLYLKKRVPDYSYEQHIGGVRYLFVRGMDATCDNIGVYQTKPELIKIKQLAEMFITE